MISRTLPWSPCRAIIVTLLLAPVASASSTNANLQALLDRSAGGIFQLPAGMHVINQALRITKDNTELHGPGRIIQSNPAEPIIRLDNVRGVRISNLSVTRAEGRQEAEAAGIEIMNCQDIDVSQVRVLDNHSHSSIVARFSRDVTIQQCTVINYKGLAIDDRSDSVLYGYAFKAMDGTGIQLVAVQGGIIRDNRVQEFRMLPTKEIRDRYDLGKLTKKPKERGRLMTQEMFDTNSTNNWHQGSGIHVATPDKGNHILITGNYIENPGQGIDIHSDNVTVTNNLITRALIGMKAMHGSKHVLIDGNQFSYCDLWGVMLMPGAASHSSANAAGEVKAATENVDGGTIVSNNIFSFFGYGDQYWNWGNNQPRGEGRNVIALLGGQLAENPPLRSVLIAGNVVYDSGADTLLKDGQWVKEEPRFRYALYVEPKKHPAPLNIQVRDNLFDVGFDGVSNFGENPKTVSLVTP